MKNLLPILGAALFGAACTVDLDPTPSRVGTSDGAGLPEGGGAGPDAGNGSADLAGADPELEISQAPRCGPAPHLALWLSAEDIMGQPDSRELRDVVLTFKHCPDSQFVTGADGKLLVMVSRGAETWIRFEKEGYLPWMVGEVAITDSLPRAPVLGTMVPEHIGSTVIPVYRASDPLVYLQVQMGRSDAPEACRSPEGVTLSVKDFPDAQVSYRATGSNGAYTKSTATSIEGVALISGLPATVSAVEILAAKPGCTYRLAYGDVNSISLLPILRTPLSPGTITHQVINPLR